MALLARLLLSPPGCPSTPGSVPESPDTMGAGKLGIGAQGHRLPTQGDVTRGRPFSTARPQWGDVEAHAGHLGAGPVASPASAPEHRQGWGPSHELGQQQTPSLQFPQTPRVTLGS